jgi:hypothetical protein
MRRGGWLRVWDLLLAGVCQHLPGGTLRPVLCQEHRAGKYQWHLLSRIKKKEKFPQYDLSFCAFLLFYYNLVIFLTFCFGLHMLVAVQTLIHSRPSSSNYVYFVSVCKKLVFSQSRKPFLKKTLQPLLFKALPFRPLKDSSVRFSTSFLISKVPTLDPDFYHNFFSDLLSNSWSYHN